MLKQIIAHSRRLTSRINPPEDVWIYWRCNGRDETSRVRDLSPGGLFVETARSSLVGSLVKIDFLVPEGQLRAEAVVRREEPGRGLGLKFTAINDKDRLRMISLMKRLYSMSQLGTTRLLGVRNHMHTKGPNF